MKKAICPQCGSQIIGDLSHCYVCGWGTETKKTFTVPLPSQILPPPAEVTSSEPAALHTNIFNRLGRRQTIVMAGGAVLLILIGAFCRLQLVAGQDLRKGSQLLQQHDYSGAAHVLSQAPGFAYPPTVDRIHAQRDKALRWVADSQTISQAKQALESDDPQLALTLLNKVSKDFPDRQAVQQLISLANQKINNPNVDISQAVADVSTADDSADSSVATVVDSQGDTTDTSSSSDFSSADTGSTGGGDTGSIGGGSGSGGG